MRKTPPSAFRQLIEQHHTSLVTIGFWATVVGFGVLGALLGTLGGALAPFLIPLGLFGGGFMGSVVFVGLQKFCNWEAQRASWPDTHKYAQHSVATKVPPTKRWATLRTWLHLKPSTEAARKADTEGYETYIADGFWSSFGRQLREVGAYSKQMLLEGPKGYWRRHGLALSHEGDQTSISSIDLLDETRAPLLQPLRSIQPPKQAEGHTIDQALKHIRNR